MRAALSAFKCDLPVEVFILQIHFFACTEKEFVETSNCFIQHTSAPQRVRAEIYRQPDVIPKAVIGNDFIIIRTYSNSKKYCTDLTTVFKINPFKQHLSRFVSRIV